MLIWLYVTNMSKEVTNPWSTCNAVMADSLQNGVTQLQLFPVELRGNPSHIEWQHLSLNTEAFPIQLTCKVSYTGFLSISKSIYSQTEVPRVKLHTAAEQTLMNTTNRKGRSYSSFSPVSLTAQVPLQCLPDPLLG